MPMPMPIPVTMSMPRCRCRDFQMASIKTIFGGCFLTIEFNEKFFIRVIKSFINRNNSLQFTVRAEQEEMEKQGEPASIFYY